MSFADVGLDPRILRGLQQRGLSKPTAVQLECIPKLLEGKDVVAGARTGSGKTFAYLLPTLHKVVTSSQLDLSWQALVLVPTKELCEQVKMEAQTTAAHSCPGIQVTSLVAEGGVQASAGVAQAGQVVVSTPGRIASLLRCGQLPASLLQSHLRTLVLDEADLLLAFGYWEDLQMVAAQVPRSCQCILMSATVSENLEELQQLVLHNPIAINLFASENGADPAAAASAAGSASKIQHFALECPQEDRLLYTMSLLKLGMVRQKVLLFTTCASSGYRLRLFLESFGVRVALIHSEMPLNTRSHILQSFNKGLFDHLIAVETLDPVSGPAGGGVLACTSEGTKRKTKKGHKVEENKNNKTCVKDEESGVTRGIDFKGVRTVINFDLPASVREYVHRVGRTGRASKSGTVVTFFSPECSELRSAIDEALKGKAETKGEGEGLADCLKRDDETEKALKGMQMYRRLQRGTIEAFRYRAEDAARAITKKAIQEARAQEMRQELLNSQNLKEYFEEHSAEKRLLQHDKVLHKGIQNARHLKHVPAYIKGASNGVGSLGMSGARAGVGKSRKPRPTKHKSSVDPLKVIKKPTKK